MNITGTLRNHYNAVTFGVNMDQHSNSTSSIFFALGANMAIFIAKLGAALYTGSGAMLAEAVHSLADTGNQLLLLVGLRQAKRLPTSEYPLGFGKSIYFWSFIVALILFSMGGVFSVYEGIHKLKFPTFLNYPLWKVRNMVMASLVLFNNTKRISCEKMCRISC
jgi:divalent metal cation (Fe/Co/Zn/Cd) transporter